MPNREATLQFRGTVLDLPPDEIREGAWSYTRNIFFRDRATQRVPGYASWYKVAGDYPCFCYPVLRKNNALWFLILKRGADTIAARWDGGGTVTVLHTWVGLDPFTVDWECTDLNGVIVVNNGTEPPWWWDEGVDNNLKPLPGWPSATLVCRSIVAWKYHLFALGLDDPSGNGYSPYEFMWSDAAAPGPGSIPQRWDAAPETQAGASQFAHPQGFLVSGIGLRDALVVFKDYSAHIVQYVGGVFVMAQRELYISSGMLNNRCALEISGRAYVASQDDIYVTDGNQMESICTHQIRRTIFNRINPAATRYCQMVKRHLYDELWFCYPTGSSTYCTEAAIYNVRTQRWGFMPLPNVSCLNYGIVNDQNPPTQWQDRPWGWEDDPYRWDEKWYKNSADEIVMCWPNEAGAQGEIFVYDRGISFAGNDVDAEAAREGVVLDNNPETVKLVTEVWPHVVGRKNDQLEISVGGAFVEGEPIKWSAPQTYTIGVDQKKVDVLSPGRFAGFRFRSKNGAPWRLYNFRVRYEVKGRF